MIAWIALISILCWITYQFGYIRGYKHGELAFTHTHGTAIKNKEFDPTIPDERAHRVILPDKEMREKYHCLG